MSLSNKLVRSVFALGLAVSFSSSALAADQSSGCGMGWQVANKNTLISSTTRAWVNATFSSTIAMTMGTSGCAKHSIVKREMEAIHFAEANQGQLMIEMAQGRGEHLRGLVATLGCNAASFPAMASAMQANYANIFPAMTATSAPEMLNGVKAAISKDSTLSMQCGFTS